ncbi:hypothetical protein [Corynebacterium aquilae]|uniref:hypothetical protein n=1 Tax=Corynebacterium aquilae TaxID=203263 RepID=UPI0012ECFC7A|nr:hypothetical protein [Corynebacterium aquilae]
MDNVLAAATSPVRPWKDYAEEALNALIADGDTFTIDDLRDRVPEGIEPHHCNAWGALLSNAARDGLIQRVGFAQARRKQAHAREVKTWAPAT